MSAANYQNIHGMTTDVFEMAGFKMKGRLPVKNIMKLFATMIGAEKNFDETTDDTLQKFDSLQWIGLYNDIDLAEFFCHFMRSHINRMVLMEERSPTETRLQLKKWSEPDWMEKMIYTFDNIIRAEGIQRINLDIRVEQRRRIESVIYKFMT